MAALAITPPASALRLRDLRESISTLDYAAIACCHDGNWAGFMQLEHAHQYLIAQYVMLEEASR